MQCFFRSAFGVGFCSLGRMSGRICFANVSLANVSRPAAGGAGGGGGQSEAAAIFQSSGSNVSHNSLLPSLSRAPAAPLSSPRECRLVNKIGGPRSTEGERGVEADRGRIGVEFAQGETRFESKFSLKESLFGFEEKMMNLLDEGVFHALATTAGAACICIGNACMQPTRRAYLARSLCLSVEMLIESVRPREEWPQKRSFLPLPA